MERLLERRLAEFRRAFAALDPTLDPTDAAIDLLWQMFQGPAYRRQLNVEHDAANAIAPGFFVTNIGGGWSQDLEAQAALAKSIPMHRVGHPEDIKTLALFLASPASDYITGQELVIDGSMTLGVAD